MVAETVNALRDLNEHPDTVFTVSTYIKAQKGSSNHVVAT